MHSYVNKQNVCVWTSEHLNNKMETQLHRNIHSALSACGTVRPIFYDDTVTPDNPLHVIQQEFLLFLQGMCHQFMRLSHTAKAVLDVHSEHSDNSRLSSAMVWICMVLVTILHAIISYEGF